MHACLSVLTWPSAGVGASKTKSFNSDEEKRLDRLAAAGAAGWD